MTAFAEAVRLYREGHPEESLTILRSIADVDAQFKPAQRLEAAINANAPVDLAQLLGEISAAAGQDAAVTVAKARQAFEQRDYSNALSLAQTVLKDLPGHAEARKLVFDSQSRLRGASELESLLGRAREALDGGQIQEAQGFLRLARNLDPSHPELAVLDRRLPTPAGVEPEPEFEFEVFEQFAAAGEEAPPAAGAVPQDGQQSTSFEPGFDEQLEGGPQAPTAGEAPAMATFGTIPPGAQVSPVRPVVSQPSPARPLAGPGVAVPPPAVGEFQVAPLPAPARPAASTFDAPESPAAAPMGGRAPAPAPPPASGFAFDSPLDEGGVDFGEMAMPAPASASDLRSGVAPDDRVQELLDQGQAAFDAGDFQGAIETWSRIYLVDAHHAEAELRIEQARRRREEVERLAEHRFYEAREAFEQGRPDEARALCQEVLSIQPQHLEAHDLLQRLETPAAPPPTPPPSMAADEDDLFRDDFVPATIASTQLATTSSATLGTVRERPVAGKAPEQGVRKIAGLPMLWVAAGGGVLVLILAGALFMGGKLFLHGSDSVSTSLNIADGLAEKGQLADAIRVLENLSGQLEGEQANLVNERIQSLKKRLKAQATPVPSFDTKAIRATMAGGQRLKAWQMVQDGLAKVPSEPELLAIQGELTSYSGSFPSLAAALRESNWEGLRQLSDRMRQDHPEDAELGRVWAVATYNLAVASLRKYQVAPANSLLGELIKLGDDPAAVKLQQFARSYLSRPADPRYDIFVNNIELRKVE
ncbi:MAG: hypothetical protein MUF10_11940 [Thermoanaerobaculaceae bacterium]|nr:hypothetical protein [Thermoanaerobaculaceae bacterium]